MKNNLESGIEEMVEESKVEEVKEEKEKPELKTFDEQMDYLAKYEQETIDDYDKIIPMVKDEHIKKQLENIRDEEIRHKEFLEKVKTDPKATYNS